MAKPPRSAPPSAPPDEAALHEAALSHLARYGATRATLTRALDRVVARWARGQEGGETQAAARIAAVWP